MDILWLDKMGMADRAVVGGKVANLAALARDYRVPPGFSVTAGEGDDLPLLIRADRGGIHRTRHAGGCGRAARRRLEATLDWAVDIECVPHGGHLYLLQCRPITTLAPAASAVVGLSHPPPWRMPRGADR